VYQTVLNTLTSWMHLKGINDPNPSRVCYDYDLKIECQLFWFSIWVILTVMLKWKVAWKLAIQIMSNSS